MIQGPREQRAESTHCGRAESAQDVRGAWEGGRQGTVALQSPTHLLAPSGRLVVGLGWIHHQPTGNYELKGEKYQGRETQRPATTSSSRTLNTGSCDLARICDLSSRQGLCILFLDRCGTVLGALCLEGSRIILSFSSTGEVKDSI